MSVGYTIYDITKFYGYTGASFYYNYVQLKDASTELEKLFSQYNLKAHKIKTQNYSLTKCNTLHNDHTTARSLIAFTNRTLLMHTFLSFSKSFAIKSVAFSKKSAGILSLLRLVKIFNTGIVELENDTRVLSGHKIRSRRHVV